MTRHPCFFCGTLTAHTCAWKVRRTVSLRAEHLVTGDTMVSPQTARQVLVVDIQPSPTDPGILHITVVYREGRRPPYPEHTYKRWPSQMVKALRLAPCELPCCDAHHREVSEDVRYCAAHWHASEDVLGVAS